MLGIKEAVFSTLVDVDVMDVVVRHGFGCLVEQGFDESVGSTQGGVKYLGRLDVEGSGRVADLDVSTFLFVPRLFEVALFT